MHYRRLTYFLAVVDAGTVTAAAERLHIAQPALSRQLKTMERELGMTFFEPHGNRLRLTRAGRDFVPVARRLLVETRNAERMVHTLSSGRVELLRVAATVTTIRVILAPFIAALDEGDPTLLTQAHTHFEIYAALERDADFAISPLPPPPGLDRLFIGKVPIRAWVRPDHPWAIERRAGISLAELTGQHIVVPTRHSVSRVVLDTALATLDTSPERISECDDGPTILALVHAGRGVGISTDLVHEDLHPLRIHLPGEDARAGSGVLELPLQAAWLPTHYGTSAIRELGRRLQDFLRTDPRVHE